MFISGGLPKRLVKKSLPLMTRECRYARCGLAFSTSNTRRAFCSQRCAQKHHDLSAKERRTAKRPLALCEAPGCLRTFKKWNRHHVYCSIACKSAVDRTRTAPRRLKHHDAMGTTHKCRGCEATFTIETRRQVLQVWCSKKCCVKHMQRALRERRRAGAPPAINRLVKLTAAAAAELRRRALAGEHTRSLALAFGIGKTQVRRIIRGEAWGSKEAA